MGQSFIACDREQAFLMPPDPRDWLPGEHRLPEALFLPATLKAGDYTLAVAMINPAGPNRPFRLAMDAPEKEGRYEIGTLRIE